MHVLPFIRLLGFKFVLVALSWGLGLILSVCFRFWGDQHPDPFVIRPYLVIILLLSPSLVLGIWIWLQGLTNSSDGDIV